MYQPFLGTIQYFAFNFNPKGYVLCTGQLLPIQQYAALFSLLGTFYGGNGTSTFALPDLRGRAIVGQGANFSMGEKFGSPSATLLTSNMPLHSHTAAPQIPSNNATSGNVANPTGAYPSGVEAGRGVGAMYSASSSGAFLGAPSVVVGNAGGNVPFSTQNPYLALTACIANTGIYPSRN